MTPSSPCPRRPLRALVVTCAILAALGCRRTEPGTPPAEETKAPTNVIEVPELVRRNLGIEFVKTERRRLAATLRVPGHFELLPAGRREYRTPIAGRVEVLEGLAPGDRIVAANLGALRAGAPVRIAPGPGETAAPRTTAAAPPASR